MNNIRKLKKKKLSTVLNPQELAQQKLFEISRMPDEVRQQDPDIFLESLEAHFVTSKPKPIQKNEEKRDKIAQIVIKHDFVPRKPKLPSMLSQHLFRQRSTELKQKQPLAMTRYMVIDQRKSQPQQGEQTSRLDLNSIKKIMVTHRMKARSMQLTSRSCSLKRDSSQQIKNRGVANVIQVKNIKLAFKYPSVCAI